MTAAYLEFDVVPTCNTLLIRFVFGSEEYPEYVNSSFNDAFGFFVVLARIPQVQIITIRMLLLLPDNVTIVSVDNVSPCYQSMHFYINNAGLHEYMLLDGINRLYSHEK